MDENLHGQGVIKIPSDGDDGSRGFIPKSHNEVFTLSIKSYESGRWNDPQKAQLNMKGPEIPPLMTKVSDFN